MGEYFSIVCHTCRAFFNVPGTLKLREIEANADASAAVGRFCCRHPGHLLELRGDLYNYDHHYGDNGIPSGYVREDAPANESGSRLDPRPAVAPLPDLAHAPTALQTYRATEAALTRGGYAAPERRRCVGGVPEPIPTDGAL